MEFNQILKKLLLKKVKYVYYGICRFLTTLHKGKVVEKHCNCGKTYKDHIRIEKRFIPVCDSCLPF